MTDDEIIDGLMAREGGAVDHPSDRGGTTKFGITRKVLSDYRGKIVTGVDVFSLTKDEAREIYLKIYVRPFDGIDDAKVKNFLIDCGVNHGVTRSIKFLQAALGQMQDGILGSKTLGAYKASNKQSLFQKLIAKRIQFYGRLITDDKTQYVFAAGWMNRVAEFL